MAKMKSKGTNLQEEIACFFTTVAQLTTITFDESTAESVETDTLDNANAGIVMSETGRTKFGNCGFEGFYDAGLAGHQSLTDKLTTPAGVNWKVVFTDAGANVATFTNAGISVGVQINTGDYVKMTGSIEPNGDITFPT